MSVVEKLSANGVEVVALVRTEEAADELKKIVSFNYLGNDRSFV
jgi:uncharacterized protein YbjT (DUF2867 family)